MRVIAGTCRSMPLKTPPGSGTRPTQDRIKETLFNIIQNDVPGCVFLDLFCGSGGIGIEALSRGASRAVFMENDGKVISVLKENLAFTKLAERATVLQGDCAAGLYRIQEKSVDIIFMDPPYGMGLEFGVFSALSSLKGFNPDILIILETNLETDYSGIEQDYGLYIAREKVYKSNRHLFIRVAE